MHWLAVVLLLVQVFDLTECKHPYKNQKKDVQLASKQEKNTPNPEKLIINNNEFSADIIEIIKPLMEKTEQNQAATEQKKTDLNKAIENAKFEKFVKNVPKRIEAANELAGGIKDMIDGIKSQNIKSTILGGLAIAGTVAALVGPPPFGVAVAAVLTFVSTVIGLFSGTKSNSVQERRELQISSIIDDALQKSQYQKLEAEGEGLKREILFVQQSLNEIRSQHLKYKNQSSVHKKRKTEERIRKKSLENLVNFFLTNSILGNNFLGELQYFMVKRCTVDKYRNQTILQYNNMRGELQTKAEKCLALANLYSELSILRQFLMIDIASLVADVGLDNLFINTIFSTSSFEKRNDLETFKFFFDPINFRESRFYIGVFYAAPNKYPYLKAYLIDLYELPDNKIPKHFMICSQTQLLGDCNKVLLKTLPQIEFQDSKNWSLNGNSMFVSTGAKIQMNKSSETFGPFYGPTVNDNGFEEFESYIVGESTEKKLVRFCNFDNPTESGFCIQAQISRFSLLRPGEVNYMNISPDATIFLKSGVRQVKFMDIPTGLKVTILNRKGSLVFGPFYGPNVLEKTTLCHEDFTAIDKTRVYVVEASNRSTSEMVRVCTGEQLTEWCDYAEDGNYANITIHDCHYPNKTISSMEVPAGKMVEMWLGKDFTGKPLGPFVGPLTLPLIINKSRIESMKITKKNEE